MELIHHVPQALNCSNHFTSEKVVLTVWHVHIRCYDDGVIIILSCYNNVVIIILSCYNDGVIIMLS